MVMRAKKDTQESQEKTPSKSAESKKTVPSKRETATQPAVQSPRANSSSSHTSAGTKRKSRIVVKYDVGFNNQIFIRGKGNNLSWDKGTPLKCVKADEWVWETEEPFNELEFKALINDSTFEVGENRKLKHGASIQYTPFF